MAQRRTYGGPQDRDHFNSNANRNFGGEPNPYDRNDGLSGPEREAYRHGYQARDADPRTVSQRYGTTSSSFGYGPWDDAVDRAVRGEGPDYHDQRPRDPDRGYEADAQPNHRGKGPKNYQVSDERLQERICERLTEDPGIDASDIEIKCEQGHVTLEGKVPSRRMKHRVEDLVADMAGVRELENRLRVSMFGPKGDDAVVYQDKEDPMNFSWPPV